LQTGKTLAAFQAERGAKPLLAARTLWRHLIMPDRSVLHQRINDRAEWMMDHGAVEEVQALRAINLPPDATALKAIGVQQIGDLIDGKIDRAEALNRLKAATRQYAKRQCTWFRGQFNDEWKVLFTNSPDPVEYGAALSSALGKHPKTSAECAPNG
ncbi:MAG: tRNA dimethylallyltransferase, partial [Pseudomonadota bacterium]